MALEKLSDFGKGFAQYLLGNIYAGAFNAAQNNVRVHFSNMEVLYLLIFLKTSLKNTFRKSRIPSVKFN